MHVCTAFCPFFSLFHFISPATHTSALAIVCLHFFIIRYLFYRSLFFQMAQPHSGHRSPNAAVKTRSISQNICTRYPRLLIRPKRVCERKVRYSKNIYLMSIDLKSLFSLKISVFLLFRQFQPSVRTVRLQPMPTSLILS